MTRPSNLFLAGTVLVAAPMLIIFGIASLSPAKQSSANDNAVSTLTPLDKPTVIFGNPIQGNKDAAVTIVEFGDYLCAPCGDLQTSLAAVLKAHPTDVRVVWKDFPNEKAHPEAMAAAIAARCAGDQGAYWEYHDLLYANQASLNANAYTPLAVQLNLDVAAFENCMVTKRDQGMVERDFEEGQRLQIDGTPFLFIGSRRVSGAISEDQLRGFVEAGIAETKNPPAK